MNCKNCGSQIPEGNVFCTNCGAPIDGQDPNTQYNPYAQNQGPQFNPYQPPFSPMAVTPMKWFKFLIYFSLWAGAVLNLLNGILFLTGAQYEGAKELVYALYSGLQTVDVVTGLLCIALAIFGIVTRFALAKYKKVGPKLLIIGYVGVIVVNLFYVVGTSIVLPELVGEIIDYQSYIVGCIGNAVMIILNYIYFNKRSHIFVN